jgi:hypothetical protein
VQHGEGFAFRNETGRCMDHGAASEGFRRTLHALGSKWKGGSRHTRYGTGTPRCSLRRVDVVFVSRQLGHTTPTTTLATYPHLFENADHAATARRPVESAYRAMAASSVEDTAARAEPARLKFPLLTVGELVQKMDIWTLVSTG